MKIDVRFRGLESSESLHDYAVRRVHLHLSRFGPELTAVTVRIGDVNGPKGGLDKRCQIMARGPRLGVTAVEGMSGDAWAAIDVTIERVARTVGRELERARSLGYAGPSLRRAS